MPRWLVLLGALLAACVTPTPLPTTAPTVPTLPVARPTPAEACGAEAAIALAQTQSDLALAAAAEVDEMAKTTQNPVVIGQAGRAAFSAALALMKAYDVPNCLLQGKVFAAKFFEERAAAYAALAINDQGGYETHLTNGEIARQNMIAVVNNLLGQ